MEFAEGVASVGVGKFRKGFVQGREKWFCFGWLNMK